MSVTSLQGWFWQLARYNRIANERLYLACGLLDDVEYRKQRPVSFGSVHQLLNHILLGDRIWMSRFEGGGRTTPLLGTVLYDNFLELKLARASEDQRIEIFFEAATEEFFHSSITYLNNVGKKYIETASVAAGHLFNHQTHHRGQVHAMLSHGGIQAPSLDLHRILNP